MSSQNYFDLLGDDENDEPTAVIARATLPSSGERPLNKKSQSAAAAAAPTSIPTKPQPSSDAVKSLETGRGGRGSVRAGRASRGFHSDRDRDVVSREGVSHRETRDGLPKERGSYNDRSFIINRESNDGSQGTRGVGYGAGDGAVGYGGGYGVGYGGDKASRGDGESWSLDGNRGRGRGGSRGRDRVIGDNDERPRRREFDRRSGSGFGIEIKRDGSGRGNWGAEVDERSHQEAVEAIPKEEVEKIVGEVNDKKIESDNHTQGAASGEESSEKKNVDEDNELTLDEYEKILEGKRKALSASKGEERKVLADKAFESMQLVEKKNDEGVFIKVGSDKEKKKKEKEALEKEEKARKTQSINEFLKPADGEKFYGAAGIRGRGRGRGRAGEGRGSDGERSTGFGVKGNIGAGLSNIRRVSAPRIEDPGQFPTLGAK